MELKLPPEVYSLQQLDAVIGELEAYARLAGQAAVKEKVSGKPTKLSSSPLSAQAQAVVQAAAADLKDASALIERLGQLRNSAPQVHVTLAAMPSEGLKKQLAGWLRTNLSPQVLVNFGYHAALLGGMVVRTGSRTFDWSFRRQILAGAPKFVEVMRHV